MTQKDCKIAFTNMLKDFKQKIAIKSEQMKTNNREKETKNT